MIIFISSSLVDRNYPKHNVMFSKVLFKLKFHMLLGSLIFYHLIVTKAIR